MHFKFEFDIKLIWPPIHVFSFDRKQSFKRTRSQLLRAVNHELQSAGNPYKFDINFSALDIANGSTHDVDSLVMAYLAGFVYNLSTYTENGHNLEHIATFNNVVKKRKIAIAQDEHLHREPGCRVKNDIFVICYDPDYLDLNPFAACKDMLKALERGSLVDDEQIKQKALESFQKNWTATKGNFEPLFKHELHGDSRETVNLAVDFDGIWTKLERAEKRNRDGDIAELAEKVGNHIYEHFRWLDHAIDHHFGTDLERITTFLDHIPNGIRLEVVDDDALRPLSQGRDCDCDFEGGALVMKTTPSKFPYPSTWVEGAAQLVLGRFK